MCLSGRLAWFVHENVPNFPGEWVRDEFAPEYGNQHTIISPQRFGKPMSRQVCRETKHIAFFFFTVFESNVVWARATLSRLRQYNLFYDQSKFEWHGPSLRHILKLTCPLQELKLNADDMYFLTKTELAPLPVLEHLLHPVSPEIFSNVLTPSCLSDVDVIR